MPNPTLAPEYWVDKASDLEAILLDMFVDKWGFGEPPPAYHSAYQADLETLKFAQSMSKPSAHPPR